MANEDKENPNYAPYVKGFILGCIRYKLEDKVKALCSAYLKDNPNVSTSMLFHRACMVIYEDYCNDELHNNVSKYFYTKFKDK